MTPINTAATDPIEHVILLLLENRSFDQMLGCFQTQYPELEGVDPAKRRFNLDNNGNQVFQEETREQQMELDPGHGLRDVLKQLENDNGGFVNDFIDIHPNSTELQRKQIMGFYPLMFLDALHRMARDFTICDHWFSSVPGPTWTNRFFALSGTSSGRVEMPEGVKDPKLGEFFRQNQTTVFDQLNNKDVSWKVYFYDFPASLILNHQRQLENLGRYQGIDQFFKDAAHTRPFPAFSLQGPRTPSESS